MDITSLLKKSGLSEKEIKVLTALLELGDSPVRDISSKAGVNRGTAYDILRSLVKQGLVSSFETKTNLHFAAEPPSKLLDYLEEKENNFKNLKTELKASLPEIESVFKKRGGRPQVRLYEGKKGIRSILADVLLSMSSFKQKTYYVYSSSSVRKNVSEAMPDFSQKRVAKKIFVKTIALGTGGELRGLDERKWMMLPESSLKPVYELIYANKVAHISLDNLFNPVGVVIEDKEIYETQKMIFEFNWKAL